MDIDAMRLAHIIVEGNSLTGTMTLPQAHSVVLPYVKEGPRDLLLMGYALVQVGVVPTTSLIDASRPQFIS